MHVNWDKMPKSNFKQSWIKLHVNYPSACLPICLPASFTLYGCLCFSPSVCLCLFVSIFLSLLSLSISVCESVSLPVCLSICLSSFPHCLCVSVSHKQKKINNQLCSQKKAFPFKTKHQAGQKICRIRNLLKNLK